MRIENSSNNCAIADCAGPHNTQQQNSLENSNCHSNTESTKIFYRVRIARVCLYVS